MRFNRQACLGNDDSPGDGKIVVVVRRTRVARKSAQVGSQKSNWSASRTIFHPRGRESSLLDSPPSAAKRRILRRV